MNETQPNASEKTDAPADDQKALWNGPAAQAWVDAQAFLDRMFKPFEDLLALGVESGAAVLDVGCGTGSTTLAAARKAGASGRAIGLDLSEPMIAAARDRAEREGSSARFISGDAATYPLESNSFDLIISRFGVMFFADPVAAFEHLRRSVREGGGLRLIVWRGAEENPFMTTAERAAAPLLPNIPPRRPDGPGQFGFADPERVRRILEGAGWDRIDFERSDVVCTFPAQDLATYLTRLGPLGRVLQDADEPTRAVVIETVRAAFEPYVHGDEVRYDAACWLIKARAPAAR